MEDFTRTMGLEVMFQHARHKGERERERKRKKKYFYKLHVVVYAVS